MEISSTTSENGVMKKTKLLAAIALSLALGGTSAYAAEPEVTVYGVVDTSLQYTHVFNQSTNTVEMNTGNRLKLWASGAK